MWKRVRGITASTIIEIPGNWQYMYSTWRRTTYCWSRQQRQHWRIMSGGQLTRGWRGSYYVGPDPAACTRAPADGVYEPYWSRLSHAADTCPEGWTGLHRPARASIGIASYGTGARAPFSTSNCLIFWLLQNRTSFAIRLHRVYRVIDMCHS